MRARDRRRGPWRRETFRNNRSASVVLSERDNIYIYIYVWRSVLGRVTNRRSLTDASVCFLSFEYADRREPNGEVTRDGRVPDIVRINPSVNFYRLINSLVKRTGHISVNCSSFAIRAVRSGRPPNGRDTFASANHVRASDELSTTWSDTNFRLDRSFLLRVRLGRRVTRIRR